MNKIKWMRVIFDLIIVPIICGLAWFIDFQVLVIWFIVFRLMLINAYQTKEDYIKK